MVVLHCQEQDRYSLGIASLPPRGELEEGLWELEEGSVSHLSPLGGSRRRALLIYQCGPLLRCHDVCCHLLDLLCCHGVDFLIERCDVFLPTIVEEALAKV